MLIYKSGDSTLVYNERPISLLSPFSKLFEKCIYAGLTNYLSKLTKFSDTHYGFRQDCETQDAFIRLTEVAYAANNDGKFISTFFIDYSKVFETMNHKYFENWFDMVYLDRLMNL